MTRSISPDQAIDRAWGYPSAEDHATEDIERHCEVYRRELERLRDGRNREANRREGDPPGYTLWP